MATTQNTFTGNGSNLGPFSFTFKWLEPTDIKVTVAGVLKTVGTHYNLQSLNYSTKTGGQVLFTAGNAPANGAAIIIYRQTDDTDLAATFSSGSAIRAQDLNSNFIQGLYVAQEVNNSVATANTTANTALTNSNTAISTANTASTNASAAVATANTASANASAAVSTANTASANATTAVNTANSAAAAVANVVSYPIIANVAAIPATPANNTAVEVTNSTGIQSFTPLSGVPVGFVGSAGLSVRIIYSTVGSTWNWVQYFPNDPEARYLKLAGGNITGNLGIGNPTPAYALDVASSVAQVGNSTDAFIQYKSTAGNWHVGAGASNAFVVYSGTYGSGSELLRITSAGNVGIGTSSPSSVLHCVGSKDAANFTIGAPLTTVGGGAFSNYSQVTFENTSGSNANAAIRAYGNIWKSAGSALSLMTSSGGAPVDRLYINSAGSVGIGTTSPGYPLDVVSDSSAWGLNIRGRSADNIAYIRFSPNSGATTYAAIGTPSANTLGFDVNGSERARIDSSGRLLIGTSSAFGVNYLQIQGDSGGAAGTGGISLRRNVAPSGMGEGSVEGVIDFGPNDGGVGARIAAVADAQQGTNDYPSRLVFSTTADGASSPTERMRITHDGYARMAPGTGGIQFNGDTAAVNALDDYEEGTWTPSIIGSGTAGTVTYAVQNALYKKVGTCVTIQFHVTWSSGTGTGDLRVSGLPFVAAGTGNQVYFTAGYSANVALTANHVSYFAILGGTTVIQVDQYEVGGGTATNVPYDAAGTLGVTMSYFV